MSRNVFHPPLLFAAACVASPIALAQLPPETTNPVSASDASRPAAAGRIVRFFDFEERSTNPRPVPRYWTRNQDERDRPRPGYPRFNISELDELQDEPPATRGCVRLSTRGGSTSLLLDAGVVPVFQEADYLVGARIRTDHLQVSRAVLAARFLDEGLKVIPGSERFSQPLTSQSRWTPVSIEMPGEFPDAAFIQLELVLLQPAQLEEIGPIAADGRAETPKPINSASQTDRSNSIELRQQDLSGAAYFDSVSIVQLPRLELSTQHATNVIAAPEKPAIQLLVRDLTGEALSGKLILLDASGRTVDTRSLSVGEGRSRSAWTPTLPGYGWYRAVLDMANSDVRVGATYLDFAWVPPARTAQTERIFGSASDESRFWLISQNTPQPLYPALAQTCRDLRSGGLSIPIWSKDLTANAVPARTASLRPLVDSFRSERLDLAFSLPVVPDSMIDPKSIVPPDPWTFITTKPALAQPLLEEFLDAYGQAVQRWQIGWFSPRPLATRSNFQAGVDSIESQLGKLVPGPIIIAPATLEDPLTPALGGSNAASLEPALYIPSDALPTSTAVAISAWRNAPRPQYSTTSRLLVALGAAPDGELDASDAADALAKHAVRAWAAATSANSNIKPNSREIIRLALVDPWTVKGDRNPQLIPRPELAAWRSLVDRLSDRHFVCRLPMLGGGEAYVFSSKTSADPQQGGLLVVWNDAASPDQVRLTTYLGFGPIISRDIFGNPSDITDPSRAPIPVSSRPIFIEGVDSELLHFTSKLSIDPPLLSMISPETQHNVKITNTWNSPINGRLVLIEPGGRGKSLRVDRQWRINPRLFPFTLAPGETAELPMTISFGTAEEVGSKPFIFNVELAAGRSYEPFLATAIMELGLRDISFSITATPQGNDVVLEATVNNQSRDPLTLILTAFPPDMPRQVIDIGELQSGNQAIHRFTLKGVYPRNKGAVIPVAIADSEAGIRVNRSVTIP